MNPTAPSLETPQAVDFQTSPGQYRHWVLRFDGDLARLTMAVDPDQPIRPGYELKLNTYDLGVDIELADAIQRIRFEHPSTRVVVIDDVVTTGGSVKRVSLAQPQFRRTGETDVQRRPRPAGDNLVFAKFHFLQRMQHPLVSGLFGRSDIVQNEEQSWAKKQEVPVPSG